MNDLVSIIVPCYNYGFVLAETLNSIESQVHTNWEVFIIDDGSKDNTANTAKNYTQKDKRFNYIHQNNQGVSIARNLGIKLSNGVFIQFLDADDLLSADKLHLQLEVMKSRPDIDICYSNSYYFDHLKPEELYVNVDHTNDDWIAKIDSKGAAVIKEISEQNIAVISSPLIRKHVLYKVSGFMPEMKYTEDWEFWFRCAINNFSFFYIDHPSCSTLIRRHSASVSQNKKIMREGELLLRDKMTFLVKESEYLNNTERERILKIIQKRRLNIFKDLIFYSHLYDIHELKRILKLAGGKFFIISFFKALNKKRRFLFK